MLSGQSDLCRKSTEGTDFWFGFMESRNYNNQHFVEITVTARETTNFQIFIGKSQTLFNNTTYTVQANASVRVQIPWNMVEAMGSEQAEDKGIHLVSEKPVNVYALNWDRNSADVAVIYPVESLGKEYFAICYEPHIHEGSNGKYGNGRNSEFLIVASEDSTKVIIIPSKTTDKLVPAGDTIRVVLQKGEVYQVQSKNRENLQNQGDLTGSYVASSKPVAFYSGSLATTIPANSGTSAWDHLYEQIPPIQAWGREYYAVPLKSREQDRYRIMAAHDNTLVYVDGMMPFTLNRGEFEEFVLYHDQPVRIFAEKPVLVVQYSQSQSVDSKFTGGNGDPFMIILSSTSQSKNDVTFVAYDSEQIKKYYINVITLTEETGNILLNGSGVQNQFTPFQNGKYSWAQIALSPGTYRLQNTRNDRGFLAYVYGFGGVESYGYGVGFNLDLVLDLGESIDFQGDTLLLCYGESRTLDAGPYFDSYQWNTGDTTQTLKVTQGGKYSVYTTTIDGCALKDSIVIYVSQPEVKLPDDYTEGCAPFSVNLDATGNFQKYFWHDESGDTLGTSRYYTASQTGEYRITVFDKYNCPASDTMKLVVFPVPELSITGEKLVCGNLTSSLKVTITGTPDSIWRYDNSYLWSADRPDLLTFSEITDTSAVATATAWGKYSVYYRLNTIDGCQKSDTFQIEFHPQPVSDFVFEDDAKCEGYSKKLIFTGEATDSARFFWDLDGCRFVDTLSWQTYNVSVGAFLNKPPYISLVINDNNCLSDTAIKPLGAKPNFTMEADRLRGCDQLTVNFTSRLLTQDNVVYEWDFNDGQILTGQNVTKHYSVPGYYRVGLTITNPVTQCQNGFTLDSMVRVFPTPVAEITADPGICYGDTVNLLYPYANDSSVCHWEFDGARQTGQGNDSIRVIIEKPAGTVRLTVDEFGCISQPREITLKRKPHFDFVTENTEGCQPYFPWITAEPGDPNLDFTWLGDSLSDSHLVSLQFAFPDSGWFDIGLAAVSSETGCADTLFKENWIRIHPKPVAEYSVDYPVALIENATISFFNESVNASLYNWDFGDSVRSDETGPRHTYLELGEYTTQLIAESDFGCRDTAEFAIKILPFDVFTPNAFRPESEIEENRTFMPVGLGADKSNFNIRIYDRWGQLVFESDTPDHPWNGNDLNGKQAQMGNYVWISSFVDIQGFRHQQKGQVLLVR